MLATLVHGFGLLRREALVGVLACLAAVGFAIPATAAAKVTSLTSCQPITQSGKYRLDADVTSARGTDCFDISANGVRLNLSGHAITSGGSSTLGIFATGVDDNIVGPGTFTGFALASNAAAAAVALDGRNESIRGVAASTNDEGIIVGGSGNSVRGNAITGSRFAGILVTFTATDNTIIGNFSHNLTGSTDLVDFNVNCDSNVWRGNNFGTANQSCIH